MGNRMSSIWLALVLILFLAVPGKAQIAVSAEMAANSAYDWRGITLVDQAVLQPAASVAFTGFSFGAWANVETIAPDGHDHWGMLGEHESGLGEVDIWAEYGKSIDTPGVGLDLAFGGIYYFFPVPDGDNTHTTELYGRFGIDHPLLPVMPSVTAYYDVDAVDGLYLEGSVGYEIEASHTITLELHSVTGYSVSQGGLGGYFAENGLTHSELTTAVALAAGPVHIVPAAHFQLSIDEATKHHGDNTKFWFGLGVSWHGVLPTVANSSGNH